MTVSSSLSTQTFICDGSTTVFTCPFRVLEASELVGYLITVATNESVAMVNGTDFAVTGVGTANAVATTTATYSSAYSVNFRRRTARLQSTDYRDNDPFPAESHEAALDRLTHIAQEADADVARALLAPEPETGITLPAAAVRANLLLGFDADGDPIAVAPASGSAAELAMNLASTGSGKGSELVGHIAAGTGAVARTVQAKLREISVSITDFDGADPTGATSSATALSAANAALSGGGTIYIPDGTFLISSSVALNSGIRIVGNGPASIIKGGVSSFITATSKSDIEIRSVKFLSDNYRVRFDLCTDIRLIDCYADGTQASTNVTNQGFWFSGCDDVLIENPYFVDYRDAVYFDKNGSTPCGTATVRGGQIWQTKHGSLINYPTGVYGVDVRKLYVEGVTFKNIKASSDSVAEGTGYGVYEGDGTDGNLEVVRVSDCKFIDDDGYTTRPMIGCLITLAESGVVDGCYFQGPAGGDYVGFIYGSRSQVIQNSIFDGACCQLDRLLTPNCWLVTGNLFKNVTGRVLRIGPNAPGPDIITITGNTFRDCTHGPITVIYADFVHITSNAIYDCNTSGLTSDSYHGGINLDGPTQGLVATNLIANVTSGQMAYGVSAAASGSVYATDNKFSGMVTADTLNVISNEYAIGTFTPTIIGSSTAGTATYSAQFGKYTKNGRLVTCQVRLTWTGGTGTGDLKIAGLPFTAANDNVYGTVSFGWFSDVALTASNVATGYVELGATTVNIYQYPAGGGTLAVVAYDGAGSMNATITYMTA